MECDKCKQEFHESVMQLSHDVPRYLGGTDTDGRRYLCMKCHGIYEWSIVKLFTNAMPIELIIKFKEVILPGYIKEYFK